jgi:hypothetical protein
MKHNVIFHYGATTAELSTKSIYLDGYYRGPAVDNNIQAYSFDHHANCLRFCTLSTCEQVFRALELGFKSEGMTIYANDLDADTCVSIWLLENPDVIIDPDVKALIDAVGFVDSNGPAVPGHPVHQLHFKLTPRRGETQSIEMLEQFLEVLHTWYITRATDVGREDRPVPGFGLTHDGKLKDLGLVGSFTDIYRAGCPVGIVCVPGPNGSTGYTVGKQSDFILYDVQEFYSRCNAVEPGWDGGSTIGGAPRQADGTRSMLTREQVEQLLLQGC